MSSSNVEASTSSIQQNEPLIEELVLDAGPLVTQQRLIGLAKKFYIPASVVKELRDKNARDRFTKLQEQSQDGTGDYTVEVCDPNAEAMLAVMKFAKQTGDYSVLSQPDLNVLALTYQLETKKYGHWRIRDKVGGMTGQQKQSQSQKEQAQSAKKEGKSKEEKIHSKSVPKEDQTSESVEEIPSETAFLQESRSDPENHEGDIKPDVNDLQSKLASASINDTPESAKVRQENENADEDILDDDEDDEETGGEWITPENIDKHKSRALGLVSESDLSLTQNANKSKSNGRMRTVITESENDEGWSTVTSKNTVQRGEQFDSNKASSNGKGKSSGAPKKIAIACMTGDYAVQNVLLQMGLHLVGLEGTRIRQVKSWVLRCHACFKICKDSEKKFCPQCGNPTLMRTSVTSTDPQAAATGNGAGMQIHLKKNFQYRNRGTKFSLPLPKPGKAGGKPENKVPILREDQAEWQKALAYDKIQKSKQERSLQKALERGSDSISARYEDADTLSILLAGKTSGNAYQGLPQIGVGRRNPNEKHRRKV